MDGELPLEMEATECRLVQTVRNASKMVATTGFDREQRSQGRRRMLLAGWRKWGEDAERWPGS